jgi:hypothetical protein
MLDSNVLNWWHHSASSVAAPTTSSGKNMEGKTWALMCYQLRSNCTRYEGVWNNGGMAPPLDLVINLSASLCRTVVEGVSRRLPTAAAVVLSEVTSYGICGGQIPLGSVLTPSTASTRISNRGWHKCGKQWPAYRVDTVSLHHKRLKPSVFIQGMRSQYLT